MKFSSIKVLDGVCKLEKYYIDKQKFISLGLKLFCKTPNEAVVESLGSVLQKHMKPERPSLIVSCKLIVRGLPFQRLTICFEVIIGFNNFFGVVAIIGFVCLCMPVCNFC